jgi:hypothetical protein
LKAARQRAHDLGGVARLPGWLEFPSVFTTSSATTFIAYLRLPSRSAT